MTAIVETDARDDRDELTLSPAQCRFFSEEGYLSVPSIGAEAELEALRDFFDEVFEHPERHGMRKVSRNSAGDGGLEQIHSAELKFPHLLETRFFRNARHAAAQLLGVTVEETTGYNHMLRKSAHNGAVTPWHQDEEGWALGTPARLFVHNALNCWMPLDQATVESGCMQFIPRSHRSEGYHPHKDRGDGTYVRIAQDVDDTRAVACPTPAGGATFHHCRTLHYSGPNTSGNDRRAMIFVFHALPTRLRAPGSHVPG